MRKMIILIYLLLVPHAMLEAVNSYTYIPKKAVPLLPVIYNNVTYLDSEFPLFSYFPALFEKESCVSLTSKRCFDPRSTFRGKRRDGSREEGVGLGQLTRITARNGRKKLDTLGYLVRKYPYKLKGLNWKNVRNNTKLQIRASMLLWFENYRRIKRNYGREMKTVDIIKFADNAYNAGYGNLRKRMRHCLSIKGCDVRVWKDNVEKSCYSKQKLYGNRTHCDISSDHVNSIFSRIMLKYIAKEESKHNH